MEFCKQFKNKIFKQDYIELKVSLFLFPRSLPVSVVFETQESVPGSVSSFEAHDVQPSSVTFVWELSSLEANGVLTGFIVQYGHVEGDDGEFVPEENRLFGAEERKGTIDGENMCRIGDFVAGT